MFLNGREMVTLLCAGHHLDELAAGFFYAEGFIDTPEDVLKIEIDEESGKVDLNAEKKSPPCRKPLAKTYNHLRMRERISFLLFPGRTYE